MASLSTPPESPSPRRQAEFEQKFRHMDTLLSSIAAGVFEVNIDGIVVYANPAALRILGMTEEQLIGRSPKQLGLVRYDTSGNVIEFDQSPIQRVVRGGQATHTIIRYSGLPFPDKWLESQTVPVHSPDGQLVGAVVSFVDVTDRFELEAVRQKSEERLNDILRLMTSGVMLVDVDGLIEYANAPAAAIAGLTPKDVIGTLAADPEWRLTDESGQVVPYESLPVPTVLRERREIRDVQLGVPSVDGSMHWVRVSATPRFGDDNQFRGAVVSVEDVTERRALAEQLVQAQKIEGVGLLAGGIAHDFNNLLTTIVGNVDLALHSAPGSPDISGHLNEIRDAAIRGAALTRQLLTFARKQLVQPVAVQLDQLCIDIEKLLKRVIGEEIELRRRSDEDLWPVRVDPGQMEQVILNMAINARHAMPREGTLTIETRNVTVTSHEALASPWIEPGDFVLLSISDTGTGIPPEVRAHIFEPFFTTKPVGTGSGLGLSICYGVVKQAKGFIAVDSEVGRGTTFRVYLPRSSESPALASLSSQPPAAKRAGTILLVEDDDAVRALSARILTTSGYKVFTARSGTEALSLHEHAMEPFDLLITDIVMPGMRGPEVARAIRERKPDIPVLFMTGYSEWSDLDGLQAGPDGNLLVKPFTPSVLLQRVQAILVPER